MIEIGNTFALLMLLGWPAITAVMFRMLPIERALIWSILGAYMVMPQLSAINFPLVPPLNKESIPNLAAFVACIAVLGKTPKLLPEGWVARGLLLLFVVSPAVTVLTNLDPIRFGEDQFGTLTLIDANALEMWGLPGLRIYDSASALVQQIFLMLPFFLARTILRSEAAIREILLALVVAGAIYALPMLWEVRFSPQLHTQLYGFFQHDFAQAMRDGGFRPFVFMPHGLWVALFAFMVTMAAAIRFREGPAGARQGRLAFMGIAAGLVVICKSMGALVFTAVFVPMILLLKPRMHLLVSVVIGCLVIAYPLLRGSGMIPTTELVARIAEVNPERAQSLEYRFTNEDRILAHVEAKPLFGWGGWGRFMVYDPATGRTRTIVDGQWIITIGHYGWLGFLAMFGLLVLPVMAVWRESLRREAGEIPLAVSGLVLILAVNLLDMLPNGTLVPLTWLIAGALLGRAEQMKSTSKARRDERLRQAHAGVVLGVQAETRPQPARSLL